ncbi:MAG: DUF983 domain-containing protein [Acidimicrobiia bacterium]|nr:DUF983 domain-containing protein [Acidimicrobiia bacterium]MDH4308563.1 DUF983 domain-containing protein [Acidimicrobiia bacterium]
MRDPAAGFWTLVGRALRRRCPRCGNGPSFETWLRMAENCPACGFRFEREHGFWVGAMIINTILSFASLLAVFVGGWVAFWPNVPWTGLLVATVSVAGVTPLLYYPMSKSLWSAIEMSYHELEPAERTAANARVAQNSP